MSEKIIEIGTGLHSGSLQFPTSRDRESREAGDAVTGEPRHLLRWARESLTHPRPVDCETDASQFVGEKYRIVSGLILFSKVLVKLRTEQIELKPDPWIAHISVFLVHIPAVFSA